jgi:tRNA nucleotidyltransferase (CCA-adding enzyme)
VLEIINLSSEIAKQLPIELVDFMQVAGEVAHSQGEALYLVGGVVRDLLLGQSNFDLDLVVEGDAISLAQQLARTKQGKITVHPRFSTAKLRWNGWSVDLATARSESYAKPGALPTIKPGSISSDLARRDFTINAMAIELNSDRFGQLIDLYGGQNDLEHRFIRILHEKSFIDDATRIWRSLRYEQRLDFQLEPATLELLKRAVVMLDTISGDRIRYELECVLKEEYPEKVFHRADELKVLERLHPALKGNGWLAEKYEQARQLKLPGLLLAKLYLSLLSYPLTAEEAEQLILSLRLSKALSRILRDTAIVKTKLQSLANPDLTPSSIYYALHGYSSLAIMTSSLACESLIARCHIQLFLNRLRYIESALNGDDLKRMGVTSGPHIKEVLSLLHKARLDGEIKNRLGEEELVNRWLLNNG